MTAFGPDFHRAKHEWLYPAERMQGAWQSILMFVALMLISGILQLLAGFIIYHLMQGSFSHTEISSSSGANLSFWLPADQDAFTKATVIGLFPAALVTLAIAFPFARWGLPKSAGKLPLGLPKLGGVGWLVVVLGFGIVMFGVFTGLMAALGIDPETYQPNGSGVGADGSKAGAVEKTLAALAKDPVLFALALPSVILAAPLSEEIVFRGALFAGIAQTRLGRVGAVLITAGLWALAHAGAAPWLVVGLLFVMGIVLGVMLLRFGSLWVTVACHAAWNALSALALFGAGTTS